jgi:hypothetical protein
MRVHLALIPPAKATRASRSGCGGSRDRANICSTTEVDRAIDNLVKSGKMFNTPGRRESLSMAGASPRAFPEQFGRLAPQPIPS